MIRQPFAGHSLLSVALATGVDVGVVREHARATPGSGWRFTENHARPTHVEFVTRGFVEALVQKHGAPDDWRRRLAAEDQLDRAAGTMAALCDADDEAARRAFHDKVNNDRFNQPPEQKRPKDYSVPDHRVRLGLR